MLEDLDIQSNISFTQRKDQEHRLERFNHWEVLGEQVPNFLQSPNGQKNLVREREMCERAERINRELIAVLTDEVYCGAG